MVTPGPQALTSPASWGPGLPDPKEEEERGSESWKGGRGVPETEQLSVHVPLRR